MTTNNGIYGNYTNLNNKVININSLPISLKAKAIDITFPGCIPKPEFNPVLNAPIICNKGVFNIDGQINRDDGSFTGINANAGVFIVKSSNSNFDIKISRGTDDDFNKIKKLY